MKYLLDVNLLLASALVSHVHHAKAMAWVPASKSCYAP